jgi:hypothetical protein
VDSSDEELPRCAKRPALPSSNPQTDKKQRQMDTCRRPVRQQGQSPPLFSAIIARPSPPWTSSRYHTDVQYPVLLLRDGPREASNFFTGTWLVTRIHFGLRCSCAKHGEYGEQPPRFLIFDRDSKFGGDVVSMAKVMGSQPLRTRFRSPWQNGVAERWVGSVRHDLLDHVLFSMSGI